MSDEPLRVTATPPRMLGLPTTSRLLLGMLAVGGGLMLVGLAIHHPIEMVLGLCTLMIVPFLLLAGANFRAGPRALVVDDGALVVEHPKRGRRIPLAEIAGISVASQLGQASMLFVDTGGQRLQFNVACFRSSAIDQVIATVRARSSS